MVGDLYQMTLISTQIINSKKREDFSTSVSGTEFLALSIWYSKSNKSQKIAIRYTYVRVRMRTRFR